MYANTFKYKCNLAAIEREKHVLIKNSYYFPLHLRQVNFLIISYIIHYEQSNEAKIWSFKINFCR